MIKTVIKRDGSSQPFQYDKILNAISKAFKACELEEFPNKYVKNRIKKYLIDLPEEVSVEDIQDAVENCLMKEFPNEVAKRYIIWREQHKEDREDIERIQYMLQYRDSGNNAAQSSETDANANVQIKNVSNLEAEVYKTKNRRIQRRMMRMKLRELYPNENLDSQYVTDIENNIIYPHDEASSPVPKNYCEAVSMYPLVNEGVGNLDGTTPKPPKWLNSYCGQFNNLTFLLSAQCKGAVAYGEFFNYLDKFCAIEFGEEYYKKSDLKATTEHLLHQQTIGDKINDAFQSIVYYMNQPAGNRGFQSPFTNISYYDSNYWHALFDEFAFPDGTKPVWERVSWLQKRFMKWFNKEREQALLTFPVETMALLTDGKDVFDKEYKEFTAEMQAEGHSFFVYLSDNPNGLASCCRLRNEIEENEFSFTNGLTGVMTGSCNVITLNLNRITQDYFKTVDTNYFGTSGIIYKDITEEDMLGFKNYLVSILERVYKYHIAYKSILYDWEKAGMFTSSNAGYIYMNKLFSTIGINGINEAARFIGMEVSYNKDYQQFCELITSTIKEQNKIHGTKKFKFNTEFVPAEGLSSKNYNRDKADGYWVPEDTKIYNSYFYNAWNPNTSVLEKFKLHGAEFTNTLDGGVGLHCNLEEHLSKEQYLKLMDYAIEKGTSYYTFNIPNSECTNSDCHYIVKKPMNTCPKCGSPMRQWTRVVGFLRPVDGYDVGRYWDAINRHYSSNVEI